VASIIITKFHADLVFKLMCRAWLHMLWCTVCMRMMLIKHIPFPSFPGRAQESIEQNEYLLCVLDFVYMLVVKTLPSEIFSYIEPSNYFLCGISIRLLKKDNMNLNFLTFMFHSTYCKLMFENDC
jgi:hypothetical protein